MRMVKVVLSAAVLAASLAPAGASAEPSRGTAAKVPAPVVESSSSPLRPDSSSFRADFDNDGYHDVALWSENSTDGPQLALLMGSASGTLSEKRQAWAAPAGWHGRIKHVSAGDFDNDKRGDLALFFEQPSGYAAVYGIVYDPATGMFGQPKLYWEAPEWGTGTRFVAAGNFDASGGTDLALFYQYDSSHVVVFQLWHDYLTGPLSRWTFNLPDLPHWGSGTQAMLAGQFYGDGKADIALLYSYGDGHVSLWTYILQRDKYSTPKITRQWDAPRWGTGTRFAHTGNFAGDTREDIALFYDYGLGHTTAFTMTAAQGQGDIRLTGPAVLWDGPVWGGGTTFVTAGNYTVKDERTELGLFYLYTSNVMRMFTLTPVTGGGYSGPGTRWSSDYPGSAIRAAL